ncbi:hypothetical protein HZS_3649, partial [Henneguya salminicola]
GIKPSIFLNAQCNSNKIFAFVKDEIKHDNIDFQNKTRTLKLNSFEQKCFIEQQYTLQSIPEVLRSSLQNALSFIPNDLSMFLIEKIYTDSHHLQNLINVMTKINRMSNWESNEIDFIKNRLKMFCDQELWTNYICEIYQKIKIILNIFIEDELLSVEGIQTDNMINDFLYDNIDAIKQNLTQKTTNILLKNIGEEIIYKNLRFDSLK